MPVKIEPDALTEAEILVNQGLIIPAMQMLHAQLDLDPERQDIRDRLTALQALHAPQKPLGAPAERIPQNGAAVLWLAALLVAIIASVYLVL